MCQPTEVTITTLPVVLRAGEDGWIVAECPAPIGCISQGRTRDDALANIREAIELCLEASGAADAARGGALTFDGAHRAPRRRR